MSARAPASFAVEGLALDVSTERHASGELFKPSAFFESQFEGEVWRLFRHQATPQMSRKEPLAGF